MGKIRVKEIMKVYEEFMPSEPHIKEDKEVDFSNYYETSDDKVWRIWYKWAVKFDESLKKQTQIFAQNVFDSGAYYYKEQNRESVNYVLDNAYFSALSLRICSTLNYDCLSFEERQRISECNLFEVIQQSVADVEQLISSESGVTPNIHITTEIPETTQIIFVKSQLRYILCELMKNACKSLIRRHGILALDELEKEDGVSIYLRPISSGFMLEITDQGEGLTPQEKDLARGYFYTTDDLESKTVTLDTFGLPFSGIGFGIPRVNTYMTFNGAKMLLYSKGKNEGAKCTLFFEKSNIISSLS